MRERRKKKKLATSMGEKEDEEDGNGPKTPIEDGEPTAAFSEIEMSTPTKRPRTEALIEAGEPDHTEGQESAEAAPSEPSNKRRNLELRKKMIKGKLNVVVPVFDSSKETKKFRKDARRQLKQENIKEENIVFVSEDDLPREFWGRKKKTNFPSIKELLTEKKKFEKEHTEEEKLRHKLHNIPEEEKKKYLALDCEMVGIGTDGKKSALARVSIVDWDLNVVLDSFVKVPIRVTDFRTHVSGVEPKHIKDKNAMDVERCRKVVAELFKGKIIVGHALTNDFKALMLNHPKAEIRDTSKFRPFQRFANGKWRARKLRDIVKENLKDRSTFQSGEHDSVQDASATMEVFQLVRAQWEKEITNKQK